MNTITPFFLSHYHLERLARQHKDSFKKADPFPYVIVDDFFPKIVIDTILDEFSAIPQEHWLHYKMENRADKYECKDPEHLGPLTRQVIAELNSRPFIPFLAELSGISGLIPDPYLFGAGFHRINRGGYLGIHADFNFYKDLGVYRRLNALVYLSKEWKAEWGGELELWDKEMKECRAKLLPKYNRLVIFSVEDQHYHGYPLPLTCPEGVERRSIALFYYTAQPGSAIKDHHGTVYRDVPGQNPY